MIPNQSRACQRSHWKVHKPRCAQHKEQAEKLNARHQEPSGDSNDATLRPQDMLNEVGSWKKRAMPFLFQAGYNAFDLAGNYLAWIDNFLVISLERLPEVDASSPHWSRFRVLKVEKMHVRDFCEEAAMSPKDVKDLVDQKTLMEDENIRKGAHGTISIALKISCPRFPDVALVNFLYAAYMKGDERAINITSNWKEEFMDSLGKMCEGDA